MLDDENLHALDICFEVRCQKFLSSFRIRNFSIFSAEVDAFATGQLIDNLISDIFGLYYKLRQGSRSQTHVQTLRVAPHPGLESNCIVTPRV